MNRTARAAGATRAATDPAFVLQLKAGERIVSLTRDELAKLPQRTHRLPIACVEGWSRNAVWTGVAVKDLLALVGAPVRVDGHRTVDADAWRLSHVGAAGGLRGRPANAAGFGAQRRAAEPRPRLPVPDHHARPARGAPDEMGPRIRGQDMKLARLLLLLTGVRFGLWGVWLMRDFTSQQLISMGTWLAGGVILHDAIIAPVTVLLGVVAARVLPGRTRSVAAIAFLVWATLTVGVRQRALGSGRQA